MIKFRKNRRLQEYKIILEYLKGEFQAEVKKPGLTKRALSLSHEIHHLNEIVTHHGR